MADAIRKNLWTFLTAIMGVLLSVASYSYATGRTVQAYDSRIGALEKQSTSEEAERRGLREKLGEINENLIQLRAEQNILHGRPAEWRAR
jgi:hypothetical protein